MLPEQSLKLKAQFCAFNFSNVDGQSNGGLMMQNDANWENLRQNMTDTVPKYPKMVAGIKSAILRF